MPDSGSLRAPAVLAYSILFLFFFQLVTDFISGIYAFGVLGTGLPAEMAALALFLMPFLLLPFRRGLPTAVIVVLAELILLSRVTEVFLPTRAQLLVAGVGVGLFLFLFPVLLWQHSQKSDSDAASTMTAGLVLAIALSILLRSLGSTMDLSNEGGFRAIAGLLAIVAAALIPETVRFEPGQAVVDRARRPPAAWGKTLALSIGVDSVFLLLYFAFANPSVIARWTRANDLLILLLATLALVLFVWLLASGRRVSRNQVLILAALLTAALGLTLAVNQVAFPKEATGYPLVEPEISPILAPAPLVLLLTFPTLFLAFGLLVEEMILTRPPMTQLALGFGLASLVMLVMTLANVFTSVWAYVDPILEPISRNRFWHVHFLAGLLLTLSLLAVSQKAVRRVTEASGRTRGWGFAGLVTALSVFSVVAAWLLSPRPAAPEAANSLQVVGYNLQQGYDIHGQRGHRAQCALLKEIDADVIGLSETDTARIAGGNFDLVRYLAQCLDMEPYYGPRTAAGTFGYAVLSKYPIEKPETVHLYSGPELPSSDEPGTTSAGDQVAVVKAQVSVGGTTLNLFVNHFDSNPPREQPLGFVNLSDGLDHVIAVGDYNCRPDSECFDILTQDLVHCAATSDHPEAARGMVDHIFVSPDLRCPTYSYINSDASDHPAVVAEIEW